MPKDLITVNEHAIMGFLKEGRQEERKEGWSNNFHCLFYSPSPPYLVWKMTLETTTSKLFFSFLLNAKSQSFARTVSISVLSSGTELAEVALGSYSSASDFK